MIEKSFNKKNIYILLIATAITTLLAFRFIISSVRADSLYRKSFQQTKPYLKSLLINYYSQNLSNLTKAIRLRKDNAEYYAEKANYLFKAVNDDLREELSIEEEEIEKLYKRAIELNPTDFEHRLNLGSFYMDKDIKAAEEQLLTAARLYPKGYQVYLYLGAFYLWNKRYIEAFYSFISSYERGQATWRRKNIFAEVKEEIGDCPQLYLSKRKELKFITKSNTTELNLKKEGFPHSQVPFRIRIYAKKKLNEAGIYKEDSLHGRFEWIKKQKKFHLYEYNLNPLPIGSYIDDFKIKVDPSSSVDQIEFIYKF